ncbi:MAG: hypothetical protein ACE5GF_08250 [Thermodesulfobacteriota bacterium]
MMISSYYFLTSQDPAQRRQIRDSIVTHQSQGGVKKAGRIVFHGQGDITPLAAILYGWKKEKQAPYKQLLASFRHRGKDYPLIGINNRKVAVNFDFFEWERRLLHEEYKSFKRPLYTRLPFPYYRIPLPLRNMGLRALSSLGGGGKEKERLQKFPSFPTEPALDQMRRTIWEAAATVVKIKLNKRPYHGGKRGCLLLTHDIETSEGLRNVEHMRAIERSFDYPSSWSIISKRYTTNDTLLISLIDEGCEIISHGYLHDGRIPYLRRGEILKRLEHLFIVKPWLKGKVNGYRSGQLVTSPRLFRCVAQRFKYDLSLPDTEKNGPYGTRGCCSIYPFYHGANILEIPLTVPQDYFYLHIHRYTKERILNLWERKIDYIEKNNGVAVLLLHPDNYLSGNEEMLTIYRSLLHFISSRDLWVTTPGALTTYLQGIADWPH